MNLKNLMTKNWIRLLLLVIFFIIIVPPFFQGTPMGRDWTSYRHPHLEYFARYGLSLGVLWQQGGGTLISMDPSLMVYDPLFAVLNALLPYPTSISLYIVILWLCSLLAADSLLTQLGIKRYARFIGVVAYAFSGLAVSIMTEEFFTMYFMLSICAWAFLLCSKKMTWFHLLIGTISFYYLGYTAAPGVLLTLIAGVIWFLPEKRHKYLFIKLWAYAAVGLVFPYTGLLAALLLHLTPDDGLWYVWSFHPLRIISFFIPDLSYTPDSLEWFDHYFGKSGQHKAYFLSLTLPVVIGFGLFTAKNHFKKPFMKKLFILSFIFLGCSMVGILPKPLLFLVRKLPFFWDRYPEKFLLIAIPFLIILSAFSLSSLSDLNFSKIRKSFFYYFCFIILSFIIVSLSTQGRFLTYVKTLNLQTQFLIIVQFLILLCAGMFHLKDKVRDILFCFSLCLWLPFSYNNLRAEVQPYAVLTPNGLFSQAVAEAIFGEIVVFDRSAVMNGCIERHPTNFLEVCHMYYKNGLFDLYFYNPFGPTSFRQFQPMPLELAAVNFKPHYMFIDRSLDPQKVCKNLKEKNDSILGCKVFPKSKFDSPLALLEFSHRNEIKVMKTTNYYSLDLSVNAGFNAMRVPFVVPPGGQVFLDGKEVFWERDSFGTIVRLSGGPIHTIQPEQHDISITYNGLITKISILLSAFWLMILLVQYFVKKRMRVV